MVNLKLKGYEGYKISREGILYGTKNGKELSYIINKWGYKRYSLKKDGKTKSYFAHTLVAMHYLGDKPFETAQIDHINEDKLDNRVENLRWISPAENTRRSRNPKSGEHNIYLRGDKYFVKRKRNGKYYTSKLFNTLEDAKAHRDTL
jgi:hypothetical protein